MDPQAFQAEVTQWITSIVAILIALITGGFAVYNFIQGKVNEIKANANKERLDRHAEKIDDLLKNSTPPGSAINIGQVAEAPIAAAPADPPTVKEGE